VPIFEAVRFDSRTDLLQATALDSNVNIPGQARRKRIDPLHMKKCRQAPDNSVSDPGLIQRGSKAFCDIQDLIHKILECSVDEHGFSLS